MKLMKVWLEVERGRYIKEVAWQLEMRSMNNDREWVPLPAKAVADNLLSHDAAIGMDVANLLLANGGKLVSVCEATPVEVAPFTKGVLAIIDVTNYIPPESEDSVKNDIISDVFRMVEDEPEYFEWLKRTIYDHVPTNRLDDLLARMIDSDECYETGEE